MESNDVQVNPSITIADWKAQNSQRLGEIRSFNPDLYSAINGALSYLNKKYGGEELVEETIVEPNIPQEFTSPTQTFVEGDCLVNITNDNKKYSVDEYGNRLEYRRVLLHSVFKVTHRKTTAEYYNFEKENYQAIAIDDKQFEKIIPNSRFNFLQFVKDKRDNSAGWIRAITWDELNKEYIYIVHIDGADKWIEEQFLSELQSNLTTSQNQTTTIQSSSSQESNEDEEDLGNLLDDLDNFEI